MHTFMVDFYPKPAHDKKGLEQTFIRVMAVDEEEAIKIAKREIQSENPELNLSQFSIEVSELLHR